MSSVAAEPPRSKVALAKALKQALVTTPLAKVTVSGLAASAGVNRQTFYSHFSDVYDLARWVYTTEVANHIMAHASYAEWADGFSELLGYMKDHHDQAYAVIRSLKHAELESFFHQSLRQMMRVIVGELEGDLRLKRADREFVIEHYTLAVLGHLLHWLATDMRENPYVLVERLEFVLHGAVRESLERFAARP